MKESSAPLSGIRVLEFGQGPASGFAGQLLRSAGAKVRRVEVIQASPSRSGPADAQDRTYVEAVDAWLHAGKLRISLAATDRKRLAELMSSADVVVDGLEPAARQALGLEPIPIPLWCPWILITPYGAQDFRTAGDDLTAAALSGAVWAIGRPEREPLSLPHLFASVQAGAIAALAAAGAALGEPRLIDISIAEVLSAYASINASLFVWEREGHRAARSGGAYPYTILPCKDGYVCMAARSNAEWRRILTAIGTPAWASEPRFKDVREIAVSSADEADLLMIETLSSFTREELLSRAAEVGCPIAPVRGFAELAQDPELRQKGIIVDVLVQGRPVSVPRLPWLGAAAEAADAPRIHPSAEQQNGAGTADWRPLAGRRIIDMGWVISGPLVGMLACELGAEVIKIESSARADNLRLRGALRAGGIDWSVANNAPTFHAINRGKLSFGVNLKETEGVELLKELIRRSDAVIENFTVGTLERMGLDDATLEALNPHLVRISLTAAGRSGRLSGLRGYAATTGALAGLEGSVGYPDEPGPVGMLTFGVADYAAGALAAFALVAALRDPTRAFRSIDASQLEANVTMLGGGFAAAAAGWSTRPGNGDYRHCPRGIFRNRDQRFTALAVIDDEEWARLGPVVGLDDPELLTSAGRLAQHARVDAAMTAWMAATLRDDAVKELSALGLRVSPVLTMAESRDHPILVSREANLLLTMANGQKVRAPRAPWRAGGKSVVGFRHRAPELGEDTMRICREILGLTPERIAELATREVLDVPQGVAAI